MSSRSCWAQALEEANVAQIGVEGERREVLRPEVARTTRQLLLNVINEGIFGQAGIKGYDLAGKTGTAQQVDAATGAHRFLSLNPAGEWLSGEESLREPITRAVADQLMRMAQGGVS